MSTAIVVEGLIKPDGTLEVPHKLEMAAGPVQVTVQPLGAPAQSDRFWQMMESIWADLRANGRTLRTREEIDAEIETLRQESEEEMLEVERLQENCRADNRPVQGLNE